MELGVTGAGVQRDNAKPRRTTTPITPPAPDNTERKQNRQPPRGFLRNLAGNDWLRKDAPMLDRIYRWTALWCVPDSTDVMPRHQRLGVFLGGDLAALRYVVDVLGW